jgi:Domain of Unknown Function (DUF1080)
MKVERRHRKLRGLIASVAASVLLAAGILGLSASPASANSAGSSFYTPGSTNEFLAYNRVIRLAHSGTANGKLIGTFEHANLDGTATQFVIRQSTDDGNTWSTLSTLSDPLTGSGHPSSQLWQPFLFEFPTTLGAYPAGTLILVGNSAPSNNATTSFVEWRSTNDGATWTYVSNFQNGGGEGDGIWEPFLALDSSGNLNAYFSDERQNGTYSQKLAHIVSTDGGVTWSANADGSTRVAPGEVNDVASTTQSDRPGMATVAENSSGEYFMSYEICGSTYNCRDQYKTSTTGDSWGSGASDLGTAAETGDGRYLFHSPYLVWSPAGGSNGELLMSGGSELTSTGATAPESGQVIFANTNNGSGAWSWLPAAVQTTGSASNCSVNYSPDLLLSASGQSVRYTAASAIGSAGCEEVTGQANAGVLPFSSSFSGGDGGWIDYGGCWSTSAAGVYSETCGGGGGNKAIAGSTGWTNYTAQGDVEVNSGTQAGLLVRASNPSTGTDALNGYYIGIDTGGHLNLGRESSGWTALQSATIPTGVSLNSWFHVTVQASGCTFTVSAVPVGSTASPTSFSYTDTGCTFTSGAIGVRDQGSTASFRNITAAAGATTSTSTATYLAPFASGAATGWTTYGGTWSTSSSAESYTDTAGGAGDKAVAGSTSWGNYTANGDVQLGTSTGGNSNAGFIVRVTNPAVGVDSLDGYFAGVSSTQLVLGKEAYGWTALATTNLPVSLSTSAWYHLTIEVVGCTIIATGQPTAGGSQVSASYTDTGCTFTSGQVGVRTFNSAASWRDITVTPR